MIIRVYYRKIYTNGLDKIPKDKPLLIVSNHPNGFLEPIIMACLFPIDLHFLVRGDLFENKALRWLLVSTNQVPIYRFKDGIAALRNNQKTIAKTIEVLKQNKAIIIFAEGSTDANWYVRELKKGMARMAFQCIDADPDLDLHILPIGVTFQQSTHPGTDIILNAGQPFPVKEFYSKNAKEAKEKMDVLTNKTREEIQKLTLHIEERENDKSISRAWHQSNLADNTSFFPRVKEDNVLFQKLKKLESAINQNLPFETVNIKYRSLLKYLLFPFAIVGFIVWFIPIASAFLIGKKLVKQREFISSIKAASGGFLTLFYGVVILISGSIVLGFIKTSFIILAMVVLGMCTVFVWERFQLEVNKTFLEGDKD